MIKLKQEDPLLNFLYVNPYSRPPEIGQFCFHCTNIHVSFYHKSPHNTQFIFVFFLLHPSLKNDICILLLLNIHTRHLITQIIITRHTCIKTRTIQIQEKENGRRDHFVNNISFNYKYFINNIFFFTNSVYFTNLFISLNLLMSMPLTIGWQEDLSHTISH